MHFCITNVTLKVLIYILTFAIILPRISRFLTETDDSLNDNNASLGSTRKKQQQQQSKSSAAYAYKKQNTPIKKQDTPTKSNPHTKTLFKKTPRLHCDQLKK